MNIKYMICLAAAGVFTAGCAVGGIIGYRLPRKNNRTHPPMLSSIEDIPNMTPLTEFTNLMHRFEVPYSDDIVNDLTDHRYTPSKSRLFTGHDDHGRVFINIPILITPFGTDGENRPVESAFVVFQRYTGNNMVFALGGVRPTLINIESFLLSLDGVISLNKLRLLLSGAIQGFHDQDHGGITIQLLHSKNKVDTDDQTSSITSSS